MSKYKILLLKNKHQQYIFNKFSQCIFFKTEKTKMKIKYTHTYKCGSHEHNSHNKYCD